MQRDDAGDDEAGSAAAAPSTPNAPTLPAAASPDAPTIAAAATPPVARTAPASWPDAPGGDAGPGAEPPSERYRLEAVIGRGGMGEVVSARDLQIGRAVAIKRMLKPDPSPGETARFLREARIQGRLEHPAVVPVHELWRDADGRPFFVMKQLAGTTLADVIELLRFEDPDAQAKFPRQHLLRAFVDVCLAVELAHTRGVVHRDLKPANVMLGDFGEVYVLDWGIARVTDEPDPQPGEPTAGGGHATRIGAVLGTPGYMAPEQRRGDPDLDGRADVYALGCILFEILAGEPLHTRPSVDPVDPPELDARPSRRAPDRDVAPELDAACVAATAPDRTRRVASARALGDLVQRYLDGDRDLALRKQLAAAELAHARAALDGNLFASLRASRSQPGARRDAEPRALAAYGDAVRATARALALDPTSREPAELLGRLMLEPPATVPPDVERELDALEDQAIASHARIGARAMVGYLIFFPIMYLGGLRDAWLVLGGAGLVLALMAVVAAIAKRPRPALIYASFVGNVLLIALYARGLTPLLVAPGVAIITLMIYASHPKLGRAVALYAACAAGVLVPLALEAAGAIATTTTVDGATIAMHLPTDRLDPTIAIAGLAGYVAVILAMATLLVRLQALSQRAMRRTLQLQAWQLRQLLPRG